MLSNITPVNKNQKPRETENTDARLAMHRHAPDHNKNRNKKKSTAHNDIFGEDSATVSTDALLAFLKDYLANRFGQNISNSGEANPPEQKNIINSPLSAGRPGRAEKAAQAYAHAAKTSHYTQEPRHTTTDQRQLSGDARTITDLIKDLNLLTKANVKQIDIGRGNSFLESLVHSVNTAKTRQKNDDQPIE